MFKRRPSRPTVWIAPAARDQLAMPAHQRFGLDGEARPRRPQSGRVSAANSARSARVSLARPVCRRKIASSCRNSRTPVPSSGAAAPATRRARPGSARPDTQTTKAIRPLPTRGSDDSGTYRAGVTDEFANPTGSNDRPPPNQGGIAPRQARQRMVPCLQGFSGLIRRRRSGELCQTASRDVAVRRQYRRCTRDVPACCTSRLREMAICRYFIQAL